MNQLKTTRSILGKFSLIEFTKANSKRTYKKVLPVLMLFLAFCFTGWSQDIDTDRFLASNKKMANSIKKISDRLDKDKIPFDSLNVRLQTLYSYRDSVFKESTQLQSALDKANASLTKLGDPPSAGQPKEPNNVAEQRKELSNQINSLTGISNSTNILSSDIEKLIDRITSVKANHFFSSLTSRSSSPFSKELWTTAASEFKAASTMLSNHISTIWKQNTDDKKWQSNLFLLLMSIIFAIVIIMLPYSSVGQRLGSALEKVMPPSDLVDGLRLVVKPFICALLVLIAGGAIYLALKDTGLISQNGKDLAMRIWFGAAILVYIWNYAQKLISPGRTIWNTVICKQGKERMIRSLFIAIFFIFIVDRILSSGFQLAEVGVKLIMVQAIISSSIFAILVLFFLNPKSWQIIGTTTAESKASAPDPTKTSTSKANQSDPSEDKHILSVEIIRFLARALAVLILAALILEYISFSNFVFHRTVLMALFFIFMYSIRILALWGLAQIPYAKLHKIPDDSSNNTAKKTKDQKTKDQPSDKQEPVNFWLKSALDLNLIILGIPTFLLVLGFDWVNVQHWLHILTSGFKVGAITISFKNIANGVMTFLLIIIVTRWLTGTANKRLEKYTHMDAGIRNSMITLINYFGVFLALLAALPILGFGFSQIAMIASALSVGIGFGLQNIVNDFVSGIILLVERPIKLGDWVVVQSGQGYVKRIKIRTTLIQTFDRATIVIPNSELVSSSVQNWFYNSKQGRVKISVNVGYDSDPQKVKDILLQCANDHPSILYYPAPFVAWDDFGDNALNFIVYGYLKNYDHSLTTKTELRFQIFNKLKEAGITIPFPQRDLHIKNSDELATSPPSIEPPLQVSQSKEPPQTDSPPKKKSPSKKEPKPKVSTVKKEEDKKEDESD